MNGLWPFRCRSLDDLDLDAGFARCRPCCCFGPHLLPRQVESRSRWWRLSREDRRRGGWDDDEEMEDSIVGGEDEAGARKAAASEERERERTGGAEGTPPRPSKRETATERETKKNSPSTSLPPPLPGTAPSFVCRVVSSGESRGEGAASASAVVIGGGGSSELVYGRLSSSKAASLSPTPGTRSSQRTNLGLSTHPLLSREPQCTPRRRRRRRPPSSSTAASPLAGAPALSPWAAGEAWEEPVEATRQQETLRVATMATQATASLPPSPGLPCPCSTSTPRPKPLASGARSQR